MPATSQRVPIQLGLHSNEAPSPAQSVERLVNGYLEVTPNGKEPAPVYGIPGMTLFATVDDNIRGMLEVAGALYVVAGDNFLRIAEDGTATELSSAMVPETGPLTMASDGANIVVANAGTIWVHDIGAVTTTQVTDPDALPTSTVDYLNGYFIFGRDGTGEYFISALQDPENYDALDYATAEWKPDRLVRPVVLGRNLLLMGATSIEGQGHTGNATFPFERLQDLFIDVGLAGPPAVCVTNETVYWLASDGTCRRLDGSTAKRISTNAVERIISTWPEPGETLVSAHVWLGHLFVVFRNAQGCVVYDQSTDRWHERKSDEVPSWGALLFADCYGFRLFSRENLIYRLDADSADDGDQGYTMEIVTPFLTAQGKRFSINELELIMETGVEPDDQGVISVQATRDGVSYGTARTKQFADPVASTTSRLRFGRYGQQRAVAFKLTFTGLAPRSVLGLYADVEPDEV